MSVDFRSRWPSAWITVCSALLLLAGCGGSNDRIQRQAADQLARQSEAVAASLDRHDGCKAAAQARTLRREVRAAFATGQVPPRLRPPLQAAVTRLEAQIVCTPPAVEQPPPQGKEEDEQPGSKGNHGKGKGKGRRK